MRAAANVSKHPAAVCLEEGRRRVFASALDWPGWCRSGRTDSDALQALANYAVRYAAVATRAGVPFPVGSEPAFEVTERLAGDATTDFGAPGAIASHERRPLAAKEADRMATLVAACWAEFDMIVSGSPAVLRKGPRGGGRDRDEIVVHVTRAEAAYARKLAIRNAAGAQQVRAALLAAIRSATPAPLSRWPLAYGARRVAWHVLDHAWEIEDKAVAGGGRTAPG